MNTVSDIYSSILNLNPITAGMIGFFLGLLVLSWRYRGHHPTLCKKALLDLQQKLVIAEQHSSEGRNIKSHLEAQLAISESQLKQLDKLESDRAEGQSKIDDLNHQLKHETAGRARAEQLSEQIPQLETRLQGKLREVDGLQLAISRLTSSNTEIQTRMEEERKSSQEKLKLLENAEHKLSTQFESLANKILDEKSKKFTEQNSQNLGNLINPLREQLGEFRKRVDDVYVNDSKDRASLREEIKGLGQWTEKISRDAINLTQALKGDRRIQGNWGELILERVLEQSGLRKGVEYDSQTGFRDENDNLLKPDVVIHLPEGRDVIIDSKVSLLAYESYTTSQDEGPRAGALKAHVQSVRKHIKELGAKNYANLKGVRSLDFVLMFMPIEAAFLSAFQNEDRLFSDALKNKIVVVSPTTLLATLRTIDNIWRIERQNDNAKLIAKKAGAIYDKLRGFVEDLEKLGDQLGTLRKTYDGVMNKLTRGKGNLVRLASDFVEHGVEVRRQLPKSITEQADLDDDKTSLEVLHSDNPPSS